MGLSVVGAGFGRTGTRSMKAALEQLGVGPCHHMVEVFSRPWSEPGWAAAVRGDDVELAPLLDGFRSCVDFPSCAVWRRLTDEHPAAKVVLTVRPAERWWASFDATIGPRLGGGTSAREGGDDLMSALRDHVFGGRTDDRLAAIAAYEAHNADVIATIPEERLLVFDVSEGWAPLCAFLDVPVPDTEFPHSNTTEEFQALVAQLEETER